MGKINIQELAYQLTHCIEMYGHTNSIEDKEYLARIFYYAGLLAGHYAKENDD